MSFFSYDRAYVEQFPELTDDYEKQDRWAVLFVITTVLFIFVSNYMFDRNLFLGCISAGVLAFIVLLTYKLFSGKEQFRIIVGVVVALFGMLIIQINGGSIEMHLYVYISLIMFLLYKDTKPLDIATALLVLYYLIAYKFQANNLHIYDTPVVLFQEKHSLATLGVHLLLLLLEWQMLRYVIKGARENFLDFIEAEDEVFERSKELKIYDAVYQNTDNGIIITTPDGTILSVNKAFENLTGYSEAFLVGKNPRILKSEKQNLGMYRAMWTALLHQKRWEGEIYNKRQDGEVVPFWLNIDAVFDGDEIYHYIGVYMDRSKIVEANQQMSFMAQHDTLTSLPNRDSFLQHVKHAVSLSYRDKQPFAVLSINLDRFKNINDTMGHAVGDELIISVAKRIKSVLKHSDIVARPGADEFLVLLEKIRSENEAAQVASHIMQAIQKPFDIHGNVIHIRASTGIALYPQDGEQEQTIVKAADSAMRQAKGSGLSSFEFFTKDRSSRVLRSMKLENALHNAIQNRELSLVFQPQHLFSTNKLVSAEVLLRWNSKEFGFVSPDEFIPIAEESGLIIEIGEWVFRNSCKAVRSYRALYPDLKHLAVNVSSEQFSNYNILTNFSRIIKEEKIETSDIEIELTERSVMEQTGSNSLVLDELRALGFKISVDDFGTGYSSMSYLKSLPIDVVKIDKSFVDGLPHDEGDIAIVKAILALIQSLGYETVAEGVEYKEQVEMLKDLGCDIAQGYYFSKPLNHSDFLDYLEKAVKDNIS